MTAGRILRIELRRSAAVGVALLLLASGVALLVTYPQGFAGRWMQLAATGRSALVLLWPLALAGGAWLGRRDARARVDELFSSTARPRLRRVLPVASALAVAVVTAYTLIFLVGMAWVVPTARYFPITAVTVSAVGALSLVAAGWLGMAVGRAIPRLVTAPVLAVVGFAVVGMLPDWASVDSVVKARPAPTAVLLTPVLSGTLDDFETITGRTSLAQALWLAALAATGLLVLGAAGRRAAVLAALPAALGFAVTMALLPAGGYDGADVVDPAAVELVCDGDGPQVCVTRVHAGMLPDVVGPARQALATMAAKLPNPPTRAVESVDAGANEQQRTTSYQSRRREPGTIEFTMPEIGPTGRADLAADPILPYLLEAPWEQDCGRRDGPDDAYAVRAVGAAWLSGQPPAPRSWWTADDQARIGSAYQTLVGLPAAEQQRRMAAARKAALDCRIDAIFPILRGENR